MIIGLECDHSLVIYAEKHMLSDSEDDKGNECTISFISFVLLMQVFLGCLIYAKCSIGLRNIIVRKGSDIPLLTGFSV